MVKETKFFRRQAIKADAAAFRTSDAELEADLRALARGYRAQADVLKQKKKIQKAKPTKSKKGSAPKRRTPRRQPRAI
jgi:hypothetical protein